LDKIPYFHRDLIESDIGRLMDGPISWRKLRDFEIAVNNKIKGTEGGKAVLGRLKEPIYSAQKMLSQKLFQEKELVNGVYSTGKDLLKKIKPSELQYLKSLGEVGALGYSLVTGNPLALKGILATKGSQLAAAKYLTSPRFQNMRKKLVDSVKGKNSSAVLNLTTKMLEDLDSLDHSKDLEQHEKEGK
jgi:hypothetical protein